MTAGGRNPPEFGGRGVMRSRIGSFTFSETFCAIGAVEQALDDELQSAVELLTQEKMKQWLSHPEARRQELNRTRRRRAN